MSTYAITPSGDVVLMVTPAEAKGLLAFSSDGAEGRRNGRHTAKAFVSAPATIAAGRRALSALGRAVRATGSAS